MVKKFIEIKSKLFSASEYNFLQSRTCRIINWQSNSPDDAHLRKRHYQW
jgi:hypothetical protein